MYMDISIVVPFFNSEKYIEQCIHSLLEQDYPDDCYEIIMIDNNSTDKAPEIVSRYPRIHLLEESIQSAYAARNRGIRFAKGEVIAFTDPDCQPCPQWLSSIASAMAHPGREIILGKREYISSSSSLAMLSDYESFMAAHVFSSNRKEIYFGYTNNMAVRASLLNRLGNFLVMNRGADTVFVQKAVADLGSDIVSFAPEVRVVHLEITRASHFYKKRIVYGKSNQSTRKFGSGRPLSQMDRAEVFLKTVCGQPYSLLEAVQLFTLLGLGLFCYEYGRKSTG